MVGGVVRSGGGFRVVLHAEHRAAEQAQALDHAVVEVDVAHDGRAFSVQYHPEAAAGPHDANYLFDQFAALIESAK